jgi:hypothetical protein
MIFERFDVAVVPFPLVDAARSKLRPALVLTSSGFNRADLHTALES